MIRLLLREEKQGAVVNKAQGVYYYEKKFLSRA
jgi:hypothetical protein